MKKNLILIILMLATSIEAFCQEKPESIYYPNPGNEKLEGTYTFDDGQQQFIMTLTNRERVQLKEGSNLFFDMLEGSISYRKNGKTILKKTTGVSHIQGGMAKKDNPNVMTGNFVDSERGQAGSVILTLNPQDNTAVFKLKKYRGDARIYIVTDEASRQRAKQQQEWYNRPFAIPDSLVMTKK